MDQTVPNNTVGAGLDNPATSDVATKLSPQSALHSALGQPPVQQAAPTTTAPQPQQPAQSAPQQGPASPQTPPITPPPAQPAVQEQPQADNDPYAGAPIIKPAQQQQQNDPYAGAPIIKAATQSSGSIQGWLRNKADALDKGNNEPIDDKGATDPNNFIEPALTSNMRGFADLMDRKPLTLDALSTLSMFLPLGEISGLVKSGAKATPEAIQAIDRGLIPKSAGEITQNPDIQRMEEMAGAGVSGQGAQQAALDFRANKSRAMESQITTLGGKISPIQEGASKADSMGQIASIIRDEAEKSNSGVDTAYDAAREVNRTNPIVVPKQDLATNLGPKLEEIKTDFSLGKGIQDTQAADVILKKLTDKFASGTEEGATEPNTFTNIASPPTTKAPTPPPTIEDLEAWRRNATNIANNSGSPATRAAVGKMIRAYDGYATNVADRLEGNTEGVQAYKDAVSSRAQHGARFENNDMLDNIQALGTKGATKSVDDIANDFYGSGAVKGKQGMSENYKALIRAAGTRGPDVQQLLQNGFAQKIFDASIDGRLPGSPSPAISPGKLKTQLSNLFINQKDLAVQLYGQGKVDNANQLIKELSLSEKQPKVTNASGTSYMQQHIQKSLVDLLPGWAKFAVNTGKAAFKGGAEGKAAAEASQSFSGVTPKRFLPKQAQEGSGLLSRAATQGAIKTTPPAAAGLLNTPNQEDENAGPQ